ncbi:energy transducer TonB [Mucilaginibacter sp. UR6-11]|nr:energy transducer TonB [Mucilaginibacter sp. UR6-11]
MREQDIAGRVTVSFQIDNQNKAQNIEIIKSSNQGLSDAVVKFVKSYLIPSLKNPGVIYTLSVLFKIDNGGEPYTVTPSPYNDKTTEKLIDNTFRFKEIKLIGYHKRS